MGNIKVFIFNRYRKMFILNIDFVKYRITSIEINKRIGFIKEVQKILPKKYN